MLKNRIMFLIIDHMTIQVNLPRPEGNISKNVLILDQSCKLIRKPSGGERAWLLEEESGPRN